VGGCSHFRSFAHSPAAIVQHGRKVAQIPRARSEHQRVLIHGVLGTDAAELLGELENCGAGRSSVRGNQTCAPSGASKNS